MKAVIARQIFPLFAAVFLGAALAGAQGPGGAGMGPGFAQHRPPMERSMIPAGAFGRWWNNPRMIERLKLTDDQRKAMDQILYEHREKLIDLHANLARAELAMEPLMSADQPDRAAMEAQIDKVVQARAALERANSMFLLDIRMKLTSDQWKQLRDMQSERGRMAIRHDGRDGERLWRGRPGNGPDNGPGGPPPQDGGQQPPAGAGAPPPPQ
ncbi:MAG TPA: periplasmic heavy metal sensor [Terracidiphilus sp.]|nr:periplasmic heavy metal sensor [Terracidiphilus sp.]